MTRIAPWCRWLGAMALFAVGAAVSCSGGDARPPCRGAPCIGDVACDGGSCGGAGAGGAGVCSPGLALCEDRCVDLGSDPEHCGACDAPCTDGDTCAEGHCGEGCGSGLVPCGDACVDTASDPAHCGACDVPCPERWTCKDATCLDPCAPEGLVLCGGECVDTTSDEASCGACGSPCDDDEHCVASTCQCAGPCGKCDVVALPASLPINVAGSTVGLADQWQSVCGGAGSPDATYSFTVSQSSFYAFDTEGSSVDTILSLVDASCAEVECNDDWNGP